MLDVVIILVAYLIGSIPFGLIIAKIFGVPDIRKVGSGGTGATNVMRTAGLFPALLVTFFDIAKGGFAVILAGYFGGTLLSDPEYLKLLSGIAAIVGHIYPIFIRFRGGKGVNTALGVFIILIPVATLIGLILFIIVVAISRYISLGSIIAAVSLPVIILIGEHFGLRRFHFVYLPFTIVMAVLIIIAHRGNIKRLLHGVENKFSFHSKSSLEGKPNGG